MTWYPDLLENPTNPINFYVFFCGALVVGKGRDIKICLRGINVVLAAKIQHVCKEDNKVADHMTRKGAALKDQN